MSTEQNKESGRSFFERFSVADVEGALDLLDDAVVWRAMGREVGDGILRRVDQRKGL